MSSAALSQRRLSLQDKQEYFEKIKAVQKSGIGNNGAMDYYKSWAASYDEDLISVGFKAPEWTAEYLISSGIPKTSKILDCAAGSGLVAEILREKYGFTGHIDALDGSQEMLDKAEVKNVYNGLICSYIGDGNVIPVEDNTYDHAVMSGGLAEGHIKLDAFLELIRVVKPGGLVINVMREENRRKVDAYVKYDEYLRELERKGLWEYVIEDVRDKYYMEYQGLINVWRVTS